MTAQILPTSPFADILPVLDHLPARKDYIPPYDLAAVLKRQDINAAGLMKLLTHLQQWQNEITIKHPRLCLFGSAYTQPDQAATLTAQLIAQCQNVAMPIQMLCRMVDTDLRVYELDLSQQAVTDRRAAQAMTYGMLAVEDNVDVILLHSLSVGHDDAAIAFLKQFNKDADAETILNNAVSYMGLDFFAGLGCALAARLAQKPVLVTGSYGHAIKDVLQAMSPQASEHIIVLGHDHSLHLPDVYALLHHVQNVRFVSSFLPKRG
jgi:hypothetical protein